MLRFKCDSIKSLAQLFNGLASTNKISSTDRVSYIYYTHAHLLEFRNFFMINYKVVFIENILISVVSAVLINVF